MTRILILIAFFALMSIGLNSQHSFIDLTFSAENNGASVQPDSIKVMNRTQGKETMIYWPENSLSLEIAPGDLLLFIGYATLSGSGIHVTEREKENFRLFQNYPNPANGKSLVSLMVPGEGMVRVAITDLQGREVIASERCLERGCHRFCFTPGDGDLYLLSASYKGMTHSIKIVSTAREKGKTCRLDYAGVVEVGAQMLSKSMKTGGVNESGILDSPATSSSYTFQFATNIPCPGTPTVEYEGQVYHTIQIFSQCWIKENLNVGGMISGTMEQSNNGTIEKYCYNDEPDSCAKYGGLYQWDEMMHYTAREGDQGICPPGWHLPSDEEWKLLEGAVDSQYGIGDPEWDLGSDYNGNDAGTNLKAVSGWNYGSSADLFGFSGLPGGYRTTYGIFDFVGSGGTWWTSTEYENDFSWFRGLSYNFMGMLRDDVEKETGLSVRCLRDNQHHQITNKTKGW